MRASVTLICDVLGVNRSSYKYWVKGPNIPSLKRIKLPSEVRSAHEDSNGSAGPRTIATIDTDRGIQFSLYCATRLMKELELVGC
jgi:putative transposase